MDGVETDAEALAREFIEETGVVISGSLTLIHTSISNFYANDLDEYYHSRVNFYLIPEFVVPSAGFTHDWEVSEVQWADPVSLHPGNTKLAHLDALSKMNQFVINQTS